MMTKDQNIIIVIDIQEPKNTKAYTSFVKLCNENPAFPLFELYRRDKYSFPFKKTIDSKEYLFLKTKINRSLRTDITPEILVKSGFLQTNDITYNLMGFYLIKQKDGSFLLSHEKIETKKIKYIHELQDLFQQEKGIKLNINF